MAGSDYHIHTLPSGLRVVHQQTRGTRLVHCGFVINAGSRNDGRHPGLAHCLEHMLFKGTEKRKSIHVLNRLEVVGGELNAYTTKETTSIYASVVKSEFSRAAELLTDITFYSVFPDNELKKEKKVISEEINLYQDTPEENIYDEFQEQVYSGHPMATNILGTQKSLQGIQRKDLLAFREKGYGPSNVVFAVVGNISRERTTALAEKLLSDIPVFKTPAASEKFTGYRPQRNEKETEHVQGYAIMGNLAYDLSHPKRWGLVLLNNLLGGPGLNSRLNLAIREKYGFTYHVESGYQGYTDTGLFHCYVSSDGKHLQRSMDLISRELLRLKEEKLGVMQLHNARNQLKGQMVMGEENRSSLMQYLGRSIVQHGSAETLDQVLKKIDEISASDLLDIANEVFDFDRFSHLYYHPQK